MKKETIIGMVLAFLLLIIFVYLFTQKSDKVIINELVEQNQTIPDRPLDKYTIQNMSDADIKPGIYTQQGIIEEGDKYTSYLFFLEFSPSLDVASTKTTTGQINIPNEEGVYPIVVMNRGYVDQGIYETGDGTKNAAKVFANNGFITVALDFLGYADSDTESENIFETRFQTYVTVLSLLKSLDQIEKWDKENIFMWGHSNGGQVSLTILEVTKDPIPTTLWAPVSKPFPYSVLYYTDQSDDKGKFIRSELAKFEKDYNADLYSFDEYLENITANVQIHQGSADDLVPISWTNNLNSMLNNKDINTVYYTYPGADHNLKPNWNLVVERDLEFFQDNLKDN